MNRIIYSNEVTGRNTTVEEALYDALCWALDMQPSACRCVPRRLTGDGEDSLCRAHQALKKADLNGHKSVYGRSHTYSSNHSTYLRKYK